METIVITGAAGYIGGATVLELRNNYNVIGIDTRNNPTISSLCSNFILGDFDVVITQKFLRDHDVKAIIHCAGLSQVGPSVEYPDLYYGENVQKTLNLLNKIISLKKLYEDTYNPRLIFSSSASVYETKYELLDETSELEPISPYAKTKLSVEYAINDYAKAYNIKYNILRYFNVCGAVESEGIMHGQDQSSMHIFSSIFDASMKNKEFTINGHSYDTKDGTCERDYVHVYDVAKLHRLCIERKIDGTFNVGSGIGTTNLECVHAVVSTLQKEIIYNFAQEREGDAAKLVADISKTKHMFGWQPSNSNIQYVIESLNNWYNSKYFKGLI